MLNIACAVLVSFASGGEGSGGEKPQKTQIVCKSRALIRGTRILVGDLVDILPPGEEAHRIGQIPFGLRPASGFSRIVTVHEILQCMVMAGEPAEGLEMKGAREVVVQPVHTEVKPQEIREAADLVLQVAIAQEQNVDVEIDLLTRLKHLRVPPGREGVDFKARVRDGQIGLSTAVVDLAILVDGEVYKTIPLQYKLRRYHQVLKVGRTIRKGEPLTQGNLDLVRQEIAQASGLYLESFEDVMGKVARRNLQPNRLLYLGDITDPAIVYRGQLVTVIATNGRVRVTVQGIANQDGAKGDIVSVTNQSSGGVISAVVHGPGVVVVPTRQ